MLWLRRSRFGVAALHTPAAFSRVIPPSLHPRYIGSNASLPHWQAQVGRLSFVTISPGAAGCREKHRSSRPTISAYDLCIHWEQTMSIFGTIMSAIFGSHASATPASGGAATSSSTAASGASAGAAAGSSASASPAQTVDVAAIVDKAAAASGEKLAWRTSIVDLMKALKIDSSLTARKELAKELGYTGDTNDSATMNIWLHQQVMAKLAANGGKLPPDIKH
jgi:Domain of unknown function (DUF3597)